MISTMPSTKKIRHKIEDAISHQKAENPATSLRRKAETHLRDAAKGAVKKLVKEHHNDKGGPLHKLAQLRRRWPCAVVFEEERTRRRRPFKRSNGRTVSFAGSVRPTPITFRGVQEHNMVSDRCPACGRDFGISLRA